MKTHDENSDKTLDIVLELFSAIDQPEFSNRLLKLINSLVPVDHVIFLTFRVNGTPILLLDQISDDEKSSFYNIYMKGGYLLSPYYKLFLNNCDSGAYTLKSIAPEGFFDSEYYERYYLRPFVGDEVGLLIHLTEEASVFLGLTKLLKNGGFLEEEFQQLKKFLPLIEAVVKMHWGKLASDTASDTASKTLHEQFQLALKNFGRSILTDREYDVVYLMLQGHSSKSAAREINISPETERGYRKQIYTKLSINSLAEVYSMFFSAISCNNMDIVLDPRKTRLETQ